MTTKRMKVKAPKLPPQMSEGGLNKVKRPKRKIPTRTQTLGVRG